MNVNWPVNGVRTTFFPPKSHAAQRCSKFRRRVCLLRYVSDTIRAPPPQKKLDLSVKLQLT